MSRIPPEIATALADAGQSVVAEADDYFLYAVGSLEPGYLGVQYSLKAATYDGQLIRLASGDYTTSGLYGPSVNLGPTSTTNDPLVLRAKADILIRLADILAAAKA